MVCKVVVAKLKTSQYRPLKFFMDFTTVGSNNVTTVYS